jgi:N-acetylmuramoyl-L-alanine amidase
MAKIGFGRHSAARPFRASAALSFVFVFLAASQPLRAQPAAEVAAPGCERQNFRITLDVGHTALSPGATSARGVPEFQFNSQLAETVIDHLHQAGFSSAQTLIRVHEDLFARARDLDATHSRLIISLHHDAVQSRYLDTWTVKGTIQAYSDKFAGYSIFVSYDNPYGRESESYAVLLGRELQERHLKFTMHHTEKIPGENRPVLNSDVGVFRYDKLVVLRQVHVPAVLIEGGVIVNRAEEELVATPGYRNAIAESITQAAIQFCTDQTRR